MFIWWWWDHKTRTSVAPVHLHTVEAPLPSPELPNEMPEVNWTQTCHGYQLNKKPVVGQGCKSLIKAGQLATRGSHSITQQIEVSAIPTFVMLNNPASAPALPFSPSHVFVPFSLPGGLRATLNNMPRISVAGFKSLNNYSMSGHALKLVCYLKVSCHPWGTHLQCLSEVTCAELKARLLLRHDNAGILWRISIMQNTRSAVPYS